MELWAGFSKGYEKDAPRHEVTRIHGVNYLPGFHHYQARAKPFYVPYAVVVFGPLWEVVPTADGARLSIQTTAPIEAQIRWETRV